MKKNTYTAPAITETEIRGTEHVLSTTSGSDISQGNASQAHARGSQVWDDEMLWDDEE